MKVVKQKHNAQNKGNDRSSEYTQWEKFHLHIWTRAKGTKRKSSHRWQTELPVTTKPIYSYAEDRKKFV